MYFTKQLPPPEDPPENRSPEYQSPENQSPEDRSPEKRSPENRPPENRRPENRTPDKRSPEKRSPKNQSPEALYRPIGEIPALLPPPIDGLSDQKEAQQTPAVVVIRDEMVPATKTEDGMEGGGGGGRTRPEEFPPVVVVNRSVRKETVVATKVEDLGSGRYRLSSMHRRSRREAMIGKASLEFGVWGLGFRV